jgi:outer membrane lipoprotein-sorting protein
MGVFLIFHVSYEMMCCIGSVLLRVLLLVLLSLSVAHAGAEYSVDEIVEKANLNAYYQGDDGRARVHMTITDEQGRTREREFVILRKDREDGGDQFFYVYFDRPADVRKMIFMVWKHPGADDDRWLYLPALDLVKRIAATDKRTSFVGSDFLYEDVSGRGIDEDDHELIEITDTNYVLKNVPKIPKSVEFGSYTIWIDKKTFLPMKAEYFDRAGNRYRTVEAVAVESIQWHPTITRSRVSNLETGSTTKLEFSDIRYGVGLDEKIFSERYLRRPPREAKR